MAQERTGVVTLAGNPVTLIGPEIKPGNKAPDFKVMTRDRMETTLSDFNGKVIMLTTVPSLDTGVCDLQTKRFNEEAMKLGDHVEVLTISADLPFAQNRWCEASGANSITILSDHLDMSFGLAYGTYIKEHRLECRSVFVIDSEGTVVYAEYVSEVTNHPDYSSAIQAARKVIENNASAY
jgi:thiol peroxidase